MSSAICAASQPPPTVVASTMASIVNLVSLLAGVSVLVMSLIKWFSFAWTQYRGGRNKRAPAGRRAVR
ncbi:acyl-CoA carboxylase [Geobacillus thermoleovorans]|uniref:acyl-CoA carboxylase n=1 Tax=Geobacillus TaxID=129337 RepID=UPI0004017B0D|nr:MULTISPECIES: acyl-CoA carboxylase [Geobacillus]QDY73326.1 acyl-CoA carboxylase [Geobacillus thermoleovorans]TLS33017.1 acyl-CoA carboxylase [Geobacillus thermoleovorans]